MYIFSVFIMQLGVSVTYFELYSLLKYKIYHNAVYSFSVTLVDYIFPSPSYSYFYKTISSFTNNIRNFCR